MIRCPTCGNNNRDMARFCSHCGSPLGRTTAAGLRPGQIVDGRYRVIQALSKGGMGAIYLVADQAAFDRQRVLKEMLDYVDPAEYSTPTEYQAAVQRAQARFEEEARTLASLKYPGIPEIIAYFTENDRHYIVMEYIEGRDLKEGLTHLDSQHKLVPGQPYPAEEVVRWGIQVCKILEYLAQLKPNPVVHHDIKPANLVVEMNTGEVYLVDFGTAKARLVAQPAGTVGLQKTSIYGTAGYAPPEQYKGQSSPKSDVYALAATMYHLLTDDDPGDHPFSFPRVTQLDPSLAQALREALELDPQRRSSAVQFRQALEKWLRTHHKAHPVPRASSYCVLLSAVADGVVPATAQSLTHILKVAEQQATVWAYAAPKVVYKTTSQSEAARLVTQLRAAGVSSQLVPVDETRSQALSAEKQQALVTTGEVPYVAMSRLGPDRRCHCYACGHDWTSRKAAGDFPPAHCPACGASDWSFHRLFKCSVCGHEFVHRDQWTPASQLFSACPACGSSAWLPAEAPVLKVTQKQIDLGTVRLGQSVSLTLDVANAGGGTLRGVIRCRETWCTLEQPFVGSGRISILLDTRQLMGEQTYQGVIDVISNGGTAGVTIKLRTQTPEKIALSAGALDFGTVGATPPPPQTLQITNAGGGTLQGTVIADAPWIEISTRTITGNTVDLMVSLKPDEMSPGQTLHGKIEITSNGGCAAVLVQVNALPVTITTNPSSLDFGAVAPREVRQLEVHITNGGTGRLEGRVVSAPDWVHLQRTHWAGNAFDLAVKVDGRALADGVERRDMIRVVSNGGELELPVRAVALGPTLTVEPSSLDLRGVAWGQRIKRRLRLSNLGIGTLSGKVHSTVPWMTLYPQQFSGPSVSLKVLIETRGLEVGTHTGTIVINSNGGDIEVETQLEVVRSSQITQIARWLIVGLIVGLIVSLSVAVMVLIYRFASSVMLPSGNVTPLSRLLQSNTALSLLLLQCSAISTASTVLTHESIAVFTADTSLTGIASAAIAAGEMVASSIFTPFMTRSSSVQRPPIPIAMGASFPETMRDIGYRGQIDRMH